MWLTDLLRAQSESLSDMSDMKTALKAPPKESAVEQSIFAQVLSKDPESVRHFPLVDDSAVAPTPEQIAYARTLLVACPSTGGKRHCWHCSRCENAKTCTAWHRLAVKVEFFKGSYEPYSLYVAETPEVIQ